MAFANKVIWTEEEGHSTGIILGLSIKEAEFLAALLSCVGGDPQLSRRRYSDRIYKALMEFDIDNDSLDMQGSVQCTD